MNIHPRRITDWALYQTAFSNLCVQVHCTKLHWWYFYFQPCLITELHATVSAAGVNDRSFYAAECEMLQQETGISMTDAGFR